MGLLDSMSHASLQTGHAVFGLHQRCSNAGTADGLPSETVVTLQIAAAFTDVFFFFKKKFVETNTSSLPHL